MQREGDARGKQRAAREPAFIHAVDDVGFKLPMLEAAQARFRQMPLQDGALLVAELAKFQESFAQGFDDCFARRERRAEGHCDWVRQMARDFIEIPAAIEREDGTPELVEPYGDDGRI